MKYSEDGMKLPPWINDAFTAERVPAAMMDRLWAEGWRHFGPEFFRYSVGFQSMHPEWIIPLRIVLADFKRSKSQRRVLRKNEDVAWEMRPAAITAETTALFERHKQRFRDNVPDSLDVFLGSNPAQGPCPMLELRASIGGILFAVSYLSVGRQSASSAYAIFDPAESRRSPGILTMLKEIEWAQRNKMEFCYPGYATPGPGIYEYKTHFSGLQGYDWQTRGWKPWEEFRGVQSAEQDDLL
jgi:arginine-tRNA-protein transferase